jgi:translation initiation factor 2-alpha kinase 4
VITGDAKDGEKDEEEEEGGEELDIPLLQTLRGDGQSRLTSEFEVLKWLGKGGFGDVIKVCYQFALFLLILVIHMFYERLKVRNKLDGRYYAIKRIPLIPNQKNFTKKITREVKLLSRLSHENVVRSDFSHDSFVRKY